MVTNASSSIGKAQLREAVDFMRAGHWMVRVLDPRRPPLPEITAWATKVRLAHTTACRIEAARLVRPSSLVAQRLAEHTTTVLGRGTDADQLAAKARIVGRANLRDCLMALVSHAEILPVYDYVHTWPLEAQMDLEHLTGGRVAAYLMLRHVFETCATAIDEADTERALRSTQLRALQADQAIRRSSVAGSARTPASITA